MKEAGVAFVNGKMKDGHVAELVSRNHQHSDMGLKLNAWKGSTVEGTEVKEGSEAIEEALRSRVFMKRPGPKYT